MKQNLLRTPALLASLALGLLPATDAVADDAWTWVAAPYVWGSSVNTDLRADAPPVGNEVSFSDLVDRIDMVFQMRVEGQGDRFGVFGDVTYPSLSDSAGVPQFNTDAALETTLLDAGGVWNVRPGRFQGLDVVVGLRHIQADLDLVIDPINPALATATTGVEKSFTDGPRTVRPAACAGRSLAACHAQGLPARRKALSPGR